MSCFRCGFQNAADARFCARCGNDLAAQGQPGAGAPPTSQLPDAAPAPPMPQAVQPRAGAYAPPPAPQARPTNWLLIGCVGCAVLVFVVIVIFAIIGALVSRAVHEATSTHGSVAHTRANASNRTTIRFSPSGRRIPGVVVDGTVYGIYSVRVTDAIGGTQFTEPTRPSGRFVILELYVRNRTKEAREISLTSAKLIDASGNAYTTSTEGETALTISGDKEAEFLLSQLQPGLQKYLKIVFDVPPDRKAFTLRIPHGMFTGGENGELPVQL